MNILKDIIQIGLVQMVDASMVLQTVAHIMGFTIELAELMMESKWSHRRIKLNL